jgi:asparagine synthase (glutamine-hydrolysing)
MPGLHIAVGSQVGSPGFNAQLLRLQKLMEYDAAYRSAQVIAGDRLFVGHTSYDAYPLWTFEAEGCQVVVEGLVYNKTRDQQKSGLGQIARHLAGGDDLDACVRNWVADAEGEYVVLLVDPKRDRLAVFNDAIGRLPLYLWTDGQTLTLSREVKFPACLMPKLQFDRQGIAETLLFGYTLGERTLVEGVSRLEFGRLLQVDLRTLKCRETRTYEFNFDAHEHAGKPVAAMGAEFRDLFVAASRRIIATLGDRPYVVSLSGGLDSRSVAAGMRGAGANVHAATFQDAAMSSGGADAVNAEKVAAALGIDWRLFDIAAPRMDDIRRLLIMKDGMNYAGMAFILPFFEQMRQTYGAQMVYCTGDVGDRSMEVQGPPRPVKHFDALVQTVLERNSRLPLDKVAALATVPPDAIREIVRRRLSQYPEQDMNQRYSHFVIAERLGSWNWQAEDRNRYWFWSVTPFAVFSVFDYAMNVPDEAKKYHRFYEQFLTRLCPECMGIANANWGAPFHSARRYLYAVAHGMYAKLPPPARRWIQDRTMYRRCQIDDVERAYLDDCMTQCPAVGAHLAKPQLDAILAAGCNRYNFENMLTIAGYVRLQEEMRSEVQLAALPGRTDDTRAPST